MITMEESLINETKMRFDKSQQIFKKILLAIDVSGYKDKVVAYGIKLAKALNSDLIVLHAIETSKSPTVDTMGYYREGKAYEETYQEDVIEQVEKILRQVETFAEKEGVKINTEILKKSTSIPETIIEFAKANNIDLILVGAKGISGLEKFLLGNIANKVISHANCPVLIVR